LIALFTLSVLGSFPVHAEPPATPPATPPAADRSGYLRFPDLNGNQVVFCAGGDLWITSDRGGASRRLTTHVGNELYPKFSPDGRQVAFTGEYDGNLDVFVVPVEGGEPGRRTWHPGNDQVIGWTPDGKDIIFRSSAEEPHGEWELYTVPAAGGEPKKLPLGWAARLAIEPSGGRWAFSRISTSETASWKRYRGGSSADIWVGHPDRADYKRVTEFKGPDAFPMWYGGRIYFLSDQGGTGNLWSMLPDGSDRRQHTQLQGWDARYPSIGPDGRIVFMWGGDIHLYEPAAGTEHKLVVDLPSERPLTRVRYPSPERDLTWYELAPDGERLVVGTRGELFSVPVKKEGVTLPISRGSGAREKWGNFDAKGERLVYVSDESHEERVYSIDAWGRGEAKALSPAKKNGGWLFPPEYSPDGKWIAVSDQTQTLYVLPAAGGEMKVVDKSEFGEFRDYAWSPDGRWLAYSKPVQIDWTSIYLYDVRSGKSQRVTGATTNDGMPAWDPAGRYLYFLGARTMNPVLGTIGDFANVELKCTRPYLVLLKKDEKNPMAPLAGMPDGDGKDKDKEKEKSKADKDKKGKDDEEKEAVKVTIDLEGIGDRIVELPADPGILVSPAATEDQLFYLSSPIRGMNDEGEGLFESGKPDLTLMTFELESREESEFAEDVGSFSLASDAGKIAFMKEKGEIYVVDAEEAPEELDESKVELKWIVVELDPREEWEQMFHEAWRHQRDFYWDAGMAGVDWPAERDRYATLLPRLATRADLRDVLAEMIGELSTSHTYVWGGDQGLEATKVTTGLLGADVKRAGNYFQVTRIYRGDPADREPSPLREPGVGVNEGDYILAVDHRPFPAGAPFLASFAGLAKKPVVLTVNSRASKDGARDVVVTPVDSEAELRYHDWVRRTREYVAEKTGGKIGYIHLPDMQAKGLTEFDTWFYAQTDREGLVVDARWNHGGFVSQLIIERLRRKAVSFDRSRGGTVYTYPWRLVNGPFVVLTNEFAGSDGDIFPKVMQLDQLAPVIGTRSWGGVVGIRGDKPLVDGGMLTEPEYAWWDPKDGWDLENQGVTPDIVLDNQPTEVAKGIDAQLDRAIAEVMVLHAQRPPIVPAFGPVKPKSRAAYQAELQ
jgi:tricorn protease